jgi:hypothetical protein
MRRGFLWLATVAVCLLLLGTGLGLSLWGCSSERETAAQSTAPNTVDTSSVPADDPSLSREDSSGHTPSDAVLALIVAENRADWRLAYSLYGQPDIDYETFAAEWAKADETYEAFLVRETRVVKQDAALVRVTYKTETTPPGGQRYPVIVNEPGEWWRVEKVDGLWKVGWLPRQ